MRKALSIAAITALAAVSVPAVSHAQMQRDSMGSMGGMKSKSMMMKKHKMMHHHTMHHGMMKKPMSSSGGM